MRVHVATPSEFPFMSPARKFQNSGENGGDGDSRRSSDVEFDEEEADDFFSNGPATVDNAQDPLLERPSRQVLRAPQGTLSSLAHSPMEAKSALLSAALTRDKEAAIKS